MKYSILGFNQEIVCAIKKDVQTDNGNIKHLCLDVIDLLILKDVSDFMNRSKIIKLTIDDKIYFSITHKCILEDLPILGIKKQALKDRIDKMVQLGILDKKVVRDNGGTWVGYRTTKVYEDLIYSNNNQDGVYLTTRGGCSGLHGGGVVDYNPNNTITINNSTINNKEEIKELKEKFNVFVLAYKKAGGRVRGVDTEFNDFTKRHKDWKQVVPYLEMALQREIKARNQAKVNKRFFPEMKNLQTYLGKQRAWEMYVTIGEEIKNNEYTPICEGALSWNDYYNTYIYVGMFYGHVSDGYTDDNRPNGAKIMLGNGGGFIVWNSETKTWNKVQK